MRSTRVRFAMRYPDDRRLRNGLGGCGDPPRDGPPAFTARHVAVKVNEPPLAVT
jgi:hypothetical protein